MPIIEKTVELKPKIKKLFDLDLVLFEETILISDNIKYNICFVPKAKIYDVIIEDFDNGIVNYVSFPKLSPSTLKYFNLLKGEVFNDGFGNNFKCINHIIKYCSP